MARKDDSIELPELSEENFEKLPPAGGLCGLCLSGRGTSIARVGGR